jgi:pimeloyl-ACP methyl ester carboxylesterase
MSNRQRILAGLLLLPLILIGLGMLYETIADARTRRSFPPPGQMIDVGSHRLHLQVMGEAQGQPAVILEHAGGSFSVQWAWIQSELARFTQVVTYDRPGLGWSEAAPAGLDAQQAVYDLYAALQEAGVNGPYILAGHSMGSLMARLFAQTYPDEVVSLVLVDPRDVTWTVPSAEVGLLAALSRVGFFRLTGVAAQQAAGLPSPAFEQGVALWSSHRHWRNMGTETDLGDQAAALLGNDEDLYGQRFIILTATEPDGSFGPEVRALWLSQHLTLAERAPRGQQRLVPGADHVTLVSQAAFAQFVTEAVLEVMAESTAVGNAPIVDLNQTEVQPNE